MSDERANTCNTSSKHISITDLNADCITHMCSYLGFWDKVSLTFASDRFNYIIQDIDLNSLLNNFSVYSEMVKRHSFYMKKIVYYDYEPNVQPFINCMFYIVENCPNIEHIDFEMPIYYDENKSEKLFYFFRDLILPLKQLKILRLVHFHLSDSNFNGIVTLTHLTSLDLSFNGRLTGKYISELRKLRELNLTECWAFETKHFIDICRANKLKLLSILNCVQLDDSAIEVLLETQTDLEKLRIGENSNITNMKRVCQLKSLQYLQVIGRECYDVFTEVNRLQFSLSSLDIIRPNEEDLQEIFQLKKLKILNIADYGFDIDEFLKNLTLYCNEVEELSIPRFKVRDLTTILDVIQNLRYLKILVVSADFPKMTEKVFYDIITILKTRNTAPLKIYVDGVYEARASNDVIITEDFLETAAYLKFQKFATITFNYRPATNFINKYFGGMLEECFVEDFIGMNMKYVS